MVRYPAAHHSVIVAALAVGGLTFGISQTMLIPSLPHIEAALGVRPGGAVILMTSFWVSGAVTAGIFGRLGDMFGKRRMIALQLLLFSVGALICAVSPSLSLMLAGRSLMGCAVGLFPLAYALIRDELPSDRVAGSIAILAGLVAGGAALGQVVGGLISDHFDFRAIFWISLALGAISIVVLVVYVPESPIRTGGRVDVIGAALFASALLMPLIAIAKAPSWGWASMPTIASLAIGAFLLGCFVVFEQRIAEPLIDIPTLMLPRIRPTNAATLLVGFGFFGLVVILTNFFQEPTSTGYGRGASATEAGLFLVPGLILFTVVSPIAGRLSRSFGPVLTFRVGIAIGTIGIAAMTLSHSDRFEMYLWPAVIYIGQGATFGAMPTIILQSVPPDRSGQSAAINMILRTAGSALGVQLAASLIAISAGTGGDPTDGGYTAAFALLTASGAGALLVAFKIPRSSDTIPAGESIAVAISPATPT